MTQISKIIVMTGLLAVPAPLAFSQEAPAPPGPASPWRTPRTDPPAAIGPFWDSDGPIPPMPPMAPMPTMPAMPAIPPMPPTPDRLPYGRGSVNSPMPVMPLMPPMPAMPPMGPMALLEPMPPLPAELADFGFLAFQDTLRARGLAGSDATRVRIEAKRPQDNNEPYYRSGKSYLDRKQYDQSVVPL